ncbi:MAG: hypothetical protein KDB22_08960 [Planctomycetales bacterium]|nr:hypothetical protein [Planctomycetales bacterium]
MHVASRWLLVALSCLWTMSARNALATEPSVEGVSSRAARNAATQSIPLAGLKSNVRAMVASVLDNPSYFRRMPTQQIDCDPQMLTFLVRNPEVMVNIWDMMGITKVTTNRTSPFSFQADDGVGTLCDCSLIYSNDQVHIYFGTGSYSGSMTPRKVTGRCVCVLYTQDRTQVAGEPSVVGTMDVFLKLDNFGADLLTRTLGPFVGKTADYNFVETARFIAQIYEVCRSSPATAQNLVMKMDRVDQSVRQEFAGVAARVAIRSSQESSPQPSSFEEDDLPDHDLFSVKQSDPVPLTRSSFEIDRNIEPQPMPVWSMNDSSNTKVNQELNYYSGFAAPSSIKPEKLNVYMRR